MSRELDEGLQADSVSQRPWLQPFVMKQPRQALSRRRLPKAAGQLGLTAGLLINNGRHKGPEAFALMTVCPGQQSYNIIIETSSRSVWRSPTSRLV
jgi:hypothetical protein